MNYREQLAAIRNGFVKPAEKQAKGIKPISDKKAAAMKQAKEERE